MEETFTRRLNDARASGFRTSVRVCGRELAGLIDLLLSERWGAPARLRWQRQQILSRGRRDVWRQSDARFGTRHGGWYGARRSR